MTRKFQYYRKFSGASAWTLPLFSIASLLSILAIQWFPSNSQPTPSQKLATSSSHSLQSLINEDPIVSNSDTQLDSQTSQSSQPLTPSNQMAQPSSSQTTLRDNSSLQKPQAKKPTPSQNLTLATNTSTSQSAPTTPQATQQPNASTPVPSPNHKAPHLEIRVALLRDATISNIGTSTTASILDDRGRVLHPISANQGLSVRANGSSLLVGDWELPAVVWIKPDKEGFVYVGDRWYRGKLLLVSQGSTFLAVNYVDLEQYLYSVVGSEMHASESIEALKAQAIAARSYALVHMIRPANPWYNLGATQRWQAYKGLEQEYNTTHQAVNETAGQVLSYKGGVVESLYAATDDIVSSVHKGRGMSQTGAYRLAAQGYDYQQILNEYYPGVSLAQLIAQK